MLHRAAVNTDVVIRIRVNKTQAFQILVYLGFLYGLRNKELVMLAALQNINFNCGDSSELVLLQLNSSMIDTV